MDPNRDCDQIVGKGADYILSLKANHPTLLAEVKAWFDAAQAIGFEGLNTAMTNGSKQAIIAGKRDKFGWFALTKWVDFINNPNGRACSVVMVVRIRHLWNKTTRELQFYLSSLPCDALRIGRRFDNTGALKTNSIGY